MEQICDLKTVKSQEIPIKVCVILLHRNFLSRLWEKISFLAINLYSRLINGGGAEAATGGVLSKKVLLKIFQFLQKNSCVGVSF